MTQVTVDLDSDTVDHIVTQQLAQVLESLTRDAELLRANRLAIAVFSHDPEEDIVEIQRHCAALQLILAYYRQ